MINLFKRKFLPYDIVLSLLNYYEENDIFLNKSEKYELLKKNLLVDKKITYNRFQKFIYDSRENSYTDFFVCSSKSKVTSLEAIDKNIFYNDVLYLKPNLWNENVYKEFDNILKKSKCNYLVIDLRGSTGGYLKSCIRICNLLLPKSEIVSLSYKNKKTVYYSNENYKKFKKLFLLLNATTASSSEILAYSLYTNLKNVVLLGEKTFGKLFGQDKIINKKYKFCFVIPSFFWNIKDFNYSNVNINPLKNSFLEDIFFQIKSSQD